MNRHQRRAAAARLPTVRTSSNRKIFDYKQTKFWPERGLIHLIHEETGEYTVCSVREWLLRAQALSKQAWREKYPDEREQLIALVENMVRVARQAKTQGDPCTREGGVEAMRRAPKQVMLPEVVYSYRGRERRVDMVAPAVVDSTVVDSTAPAAPAAAPLILPGNANFK